MKKTKKTKKTRIDFSPNTRLSIFSRVNGNCSVPRCTKVTVGPFLEHEGAANLGVACHIYSAADGGPRGRGGQSDEFIGSEKNGIWCCTPHASLIDKKNGNEFPAHVLFSWKALAEARVRKLIDDTPSPLGWVDTIGFSEYENLITPPTVSLSRNTLIFGRNCTGKTSIMEAAASVSNSRYAENFNSTYIDGTKAKYLAHIKYSTVDSFNKELILEISNGKLTRKQGHTNNFLPPEDIEVIFCSRREERRKPHEDDVDFLMRYLNIDKATLYYLATIGGGELLPGDIEFEQAVDTEYDDSDNEITKNRYKIDGEPYMSLLFRRKKTNHWVSLERLSTSECGLLFLSFAITKARDICKRRLTLLLLDSLIFNLDPYNFDKLLTVLSKSDFQSAVTLPPYQEDRILDKKNHIQLKKLDILEQWQLRTLQKSEYRSV